MSDTNHPASTPAPPVSADQEATPAVGSGLTPARAFAPDVVANARKQTDMARAQDVLDAAHAEQGIATLTDRQGYEAKNMLRTLRNLEPLLSEADREKLNSRGQDGRLALNNVAFVENMIDKVTRNAPPLKKYIAEHGSERLAIEALMRDRSSIYYKGAWADAIQLRYRDLVRGD